MNGLIDVGEPSGSRLYVLKNSSDWKTLFKNNAEDGSWHIGTQYYLVLNYWKRTFFLFLIRHF